MRYNPFQYQPTMQWYFNGGTAPQEVQKLAVENPEAAKHINSVWKFSEWMRNAFPDLYNVVLRQKPQLLDPAIVTTGAVSPKPASGGGVLAGLGETSLDSPKTDWGAQIAEIAKGLISYRSQEKLLDANIRLAEQGRDPITGAMVAPQVNVGLSPQVQSVAMLAVAGLVGVGLLAAFAKARGKR